MVQATLKYNLAGKGEHMEKAKMDAYKQYRQQAKVNTRAPRHSHSRSTATAAQSAGHGNASSCALCWVLISGHFRFLRQQISKSLPNATQIAVCAWAVARFVVGQAQRLRRHHTHQDHTHRWWRQ